MKYSDIASREDVEMLVFAFYDRVRADEMLFPVFDPVIGDNWDAHLAKMVGFWETVLLDAKTYFGRPFVPHASLPVNQEHFDRWLTLFNDTVNANFSGAKAEEAKWRAEKMAGLFLSKIIYFRENPSRAIFN